MNFYLLADSRLAEAHDTGTVELLAGAARSAPKTLPDSKLPHSQNLSGEVKDGRKREASTDTLYQKDDQGKWAPGDHTSRARSEYDVTQARVYYLLAGPRLAEALDSSTVVPLTGSACSTPKPLTISKPLHSQLKYAEKHEQITTQPRS